MGESVFTDENGEYEKSTDHFVPATGEFEKSGFVKQPIALDIPEDGTLVQDVALQPVPPASTRIIKDYSSAQALFRCA